MLQDKKILLGVTGGIAVYKAVDLVSRLRKAGADVRVIMTENATKFVSPMLFREISNHPVAVTLWDENPEFYPEHIKLAEWADILVIAPATANICAKLANGLADDMLSTTALAVPFNKPVMICPAMNCDMYVNEVTQKNLVSLIHRENYCIVEPEEGMLACGSLGKGRLPEPVTLVENIDATLGEWYGDLQGRHILVTAAGTREAIDPVRFIGNRSSGKMGYAVARNALSRGALVTLITGPSSEIPPCEANVIKVTSAAEMYDACMKYYPEVDVVIKAAAVADYRPHTVENKKIKKDSEKMQLLLDKNPDILFDLGKKKKHQILIGFAAETNDLVKYAKKKMVKKNLDMIVANDVTLPGAGFNVETNIVKFITSDGKIEELPALSKEIVAEKILDKVLELTSK